MPFIHAAIIIFDVLQIFGLVSLLIILLTAAVSRKVRRSPAWYLMITSGIVYTISYLLIIGQQTGPKPPTALCFMQASLVYSSAVLTTWAILGLMLEFYVTATAMIRSKPPNKLQTLAPIFMPSIFSVVVIIEVLVIGMKNGEVIQRSVSGMYCNVSDAKPVTTAAILASFACICILIVKGMTFCYLKKNWRAFRNLQTTSDETFSLAMVVRIAAFSMLPIIATLTVVLSTFTRNGSWSDGTVSKTNLVPAAVPIAGALIFGTQKDLVNVWLRRPSKSTSHAPLNSGTDSCSFPRYKHTFHS